MQDTISGGAPAAVETNDGWDSSVEITSTSNKDSVIEQEPAKPLSESQDPSVESHDDDSDDEGEDEPKEQPRKRQKGYVKKLTRAEEALAQKNAENEALKAELAKLKPQAPQQETPDAEPNPDDFNSFAEYFAAQRKYDREQGRKEAESLVHQTLEQREAKQKEVQQAQSLISRAEAIDKQLQEREAVNPGIYSRLNEVMEEGLMPVPLVAMIAQSPAGVEITEYLVDSRDELAALSQMNPQQVGYELARISGFLQGRRVDSAQKRQTKASSPINPVSSPKAKSANPTDFNNMSQEDFEALMRT